MTQEETTLEFKQTTIKYDYDVLLEKLNKQMDVLIAIQYGYSTHSHKHNYNKYLFAILKNIQTITESFNKHYDVKDQELKEINDKIQEIRKVLKHEVEPTIYDENMTFDDIMGVLLNDLLDVIFNLSLWQDDDIEENNDDENDDDSEDDEFLEMNSQIPDHASIINIENENKKRKCNLI